MKVVPIIPSLEPDDKLITLVDKLIKSKECIILTHNINKGKGKALKTAFRYYKDNLIDKYNGVICLDSDGQHTTQDTINITNKLLETNNFILGTRLFNTKETPFRNKLGNRITSYIFKLLYKVYIKDTQTGLRAIPNRLIDMHLSADGNRFEYEINTLITLVLNNEKIEQVDIKTIYRKDSNKHSHFNVVKDSYKVYKVLLNKKRNN